MKWFYVCFQEGASEADLSILPKYKFQMMNNGEKQSDGGGKMVPVEAGADYSGNERLLLPEDAVSCCCFCRKLSLKILEMKFWEVDLMVGGGGLCRTVVYACVHMKMELSWSRFLATTIFIRRVL